MDAEAWHRRYGGVRHRIVESIIEQPDLLIAQVPACPDWTGQQLLAHLVGLAVDLSSGNVEGYASEEWAAAQVARGVDQSASDLFATWDAAAADLAATPDVAGVPAAALAFGDAIVHEADLVPARARRLDHDEDAVLGVKTGVSRWREVLAKEDVPSLQVVVSGHRDWWLRTRNARDAPTELTVTQSELFRLLYGRRSAQQVAKLSWSTDPCLYLDVGLPYPFHWAAEDVVDR
jgi:hypothetical protein